MKNEVEELEMLGTRYGKPSIAFVEFYEGLPIYRHRQRIETYRGRTEVEWYVIRVNGDTDDLPFADHEYDSLSVARQAIHKELEARLF